MRNALVEPLAVSRLGVFKKVSRGIPWNLEHLCWGMPSLPVSVWLECTIVRLAVDVDFQETSIREIAGSFGRRDDRYQCTGVTHWGAVGSWFLGFVFGVLVRALEVLYRADRYSAKGVHERKVFRGESEGQK